MFLYMVSELSTLKQVVEELTGIDGLAAIIVEVAVTTIYTGTFARLPTIFGPG